MLVPDSCLNVWRGCEREPNCILLIRDGLAVNIFGPSALVRKVKAEGKVVGCGIVVYVVLNSEADTCVLSVTLVVWRRDVSIELLCRVVVSRCVGRNNQF